MRLLKDNVIIVVVIHYAKQRWIYGLYRYTHWTCDVYILFINKLHLSFKTLYVFHIFIRLSTSYTINICQEQAK